MSLHNILCDGPDICTGGFKTWECSIDLLRVLHERKDAVVGKSILEVASLMCQICITLTIF